MPLTCGASRTPHPPETPHMEGGEDPPINKLISCNVKSRDVDKLKLGFTTCSELHKLGKKDFLKLKGFSTAKAKRIWEAIKALLHPVESLQTAVPHASSNPPSPLPPLSPAAPSPVRPIPGCSLPDGCSRKRNAWCG
ncbi:hypothetical protein ACP4OV_007459 [Aristida adscensionis]